eukprot:5961817-Pleurochrysis_carterae.AAC.2
MRGRIRTALTCAQSVTQRRPYRRLQRIAADVRTADVRTGTTAEDATAKQCGCIRQKRARCSQRLAGCSQCKGGGLLVRMDRQGLVELERRNRIRSERVTADVRRRQQTRRRVSIRRPQRHSVFEHFLTHASARVPPARAAGFARCARV